MSSGSREKPREPAQAPGLEVALGSVAMSSAGLKCLMPGIDRPAFALLHMPPNDMPLKPPPVKKLRSWLRGTSGRVRWGRYAAAAAADPCQLNRSAAASLPPAGPGHLSADMRSILILTAGFGEGHNAAARGLAKALEDYRAQGWTAEVHDLMDPSYGHTGKLAKRAYAKVISHAPSVWAMAYGWIDKSEDFREWLTLREPLIRTLGRLIAERQPAAIVSVYPAYSHLLAELRRRHPERADLRVPLITVVTDSITINKVWICPGAGYMVTPNAETREVLISMGVEPPVIMDLGFPVNSAYGLEADRRAPLSAGEPARVLYMVNTDNTAKAVRLAKSLAERPDVRLIVTVGKREKMLEAMKEELAVAPHTVEVYGWTSELPRLIRSSHLLIGKAGGAAVQECLAAACPMIVNEVLPGQEEGNARLILEKGAGAVAANRKEIHAALDQALANSGAVWRMWWEAAQRASRPNAAAQLAQEAIRLADEHAAGAGRSTP